MKYLYVIIVLSFGLTSGNTQEKIKTEDYYSPTLQGLNLRGKVKTTTSRKLENGDETFLNIDYFSKKGFYQKNILVKVVNNDTFPIHSNIYKKESSKIYSSKYLLFDSIQTEKRIYHLQDERIVKEEFESLKIEEGYPTKTVIKYNFNQDGFITQKQIKMYPKFYIGNCITNYNYNKSNLLIEKAYLTCDSILPTKTFISSDKYGNTIKELYNLDNRTMDSIQYEYEYDHINNWIKKYQISGESKKLISIREIEYYE